AHAVVGAFRKQFRPLYRERRVMLLKLPNGDLIDSADVVGVQALEAVYVPDRVEITLADDTVIAIPATDLVDARGLRDFIIEGLDQAGELVPDRDTGDETGGAGGCNGACEGCDEGTCDGFVGAGADAPPDPTIGIGLKVSTAPGCGDPRCPCCNPMAGD